MTCIAFYPFVLRFCHRLAWARKERTLHTTTCMWNDSTHSQKKGQLNNSSFRIQKQNRCICLIRSESIRIRNSLKNIYVGHISFHVSCCSLDLYDVREIYTIVSLYSIDVSFFVGAVAAALLFLCCGLQFKRATIENGPGHRTYKCFIRRIYKKRRKSKKNIVF